MNGRDSRKRLVTRDKVLGRSLVHAELGLELIQNALNGALVALWERRTVWTEELGADCAQSGATGLDQRDQEWLGECQPSETKPGGR